ncbi:MAG: hypothetical protein U1F16_12800 [Turneriella sp.]
MAASANFIQAQEISLTEAADKLSTEFRKKYPARNFRAALAIAKFKTGSTRLEKMAAPDLVKASFEREFLRSVYFEVVERDNLDKVVAEIELRQKGLTQQKPGSDDTIKTAEFFLVGELSEDQTSIIISARLVQSATGTVIATSEARTPLDATERAAEALRSNAFQSQYGIGLGVDGSLQLTQGETKSMAQFLTAFITYRIARPLRLGAGISNISWQEYIREETTIGSSKTYRNYSLNGIGARLFMDFLLSPHPRWNFGLRADAVFMPGMKLEQDVSDMKVWEFNATTGTPTLANRRVLVTAYSNEGMIIFKPAILAEFLLSKRLSFFVSGGYMFSTVFRPFVFESAGYRQWAESADINGTFAQYQNYNFARRPNGNPVEVQMGFVFFDVGLSLHF